VVHLTFDVAVEFAATWVAKIYPELSADEVPAKARQLVSGHVELLRSRGMSEPDYKEVIAAIQQWGFENDDEQQIYFFYH
jgi:hypothetical protein